MENEKDYIVRGYVEEYIRDLLPQDEQLITILNYAKDNHTPIIHPEVAQFMRWLIKLHRPNSILELGTAIGYSSIVFCKAMEEGTVTTLEKQEKLINIAKSNIEAVGLDNRITILEGLIEDVLPQVNEGYDMIFMDAAKGHYLDFLPHCMRLLKSGGVLISDNVLFKGMIANDDLVIRRKKTIVKRMRDYLDCISNHDSLETSIIPIGDGLAVSLKRR